MNALVHNYTITPHTTFGVAAKTAGFLTVDSTAALQEALALNTFSKLRILGGGSNMLWTKDFEGLTLKIGIKGICVESENATTITVAVGAGENWHNFVLWTLANNYGGVENLALIPGNMGAAPIQNIGAYGVELKDSFVCCDALEISTGALKRFTAKDCKFGYRESVFKNDLKGQYIITSVQLQLQKPPHQLNTSYGRLEEALQGTPPTIQNVANAVIAIRQSKLPNPNEIGNCGSFFKNPIISKQHYSRLVENHPKLPHYTVDDVKVKVPAAWLIDTLGFKGYRKGDAGVHHSQPLVLVNHGNASGKELHALSQEIKAAVAKTFAIHLEEEVNIY